QRHAKITHYARAHYRAPSRNVERNPGVERNSHERLAAPSTQQQVLAVWRPGCPSGTGNRNAQESYHPATNPRQDQRPALRHRGLPAFCSFAPKETVMNCIRRIRSIGRLAAVLAGPAGALLAV